MGYWKFLRAGALSPFTGFDWSERVGVWVAADHAQPCLAGIHACRADQLPHWISDELWEIELGDPVVETPRKVVASRARLVRRVDAWDAAAAHALKLECVDRLAQHAVAELGDAAPVSLGRDLQDARAPALASGDLTGLRAAATEAAGATLRHHQANLLVRYLIDAIDATAVWPAATVAYIAARAAGTRSRIDADDPYADERRRQATWLAQHLALGADA